MKSKKGFGPVEVTLAFIVVIIVGSIVGWGFYGNYDNFGTSFFRILIPNFNNSQPAIQDLGLFRYQISSDINSDSKKIVQYYSGTEWRDFESYDFNKKRAVYDLLLQDFKKAYFEEREVGLIKIEENGKERSVLINGITKEPFVHNGGTFTNYLSLNNREYILNGDGKLFKKNADVQMKKVGEIKLSQKAPFQLIIQILKEDDSVYAKSDGAVKVYLNVLNEVSVPSLIKDDWSVDFGEDYKLICDIGNYKTNIFTGLKVGDVNLPCILEQGVVIPNIKISLFMNRFSKEIYGGEIQTSLSVDNEYTESLDSSAQKIKESINTWQTSLLAKPFEFRYYNISNRSAPDLRKNFFVIKKNGNDLLVDLNAPVGTEGKSEYLVSSPGVSAGAQQYGFLETICFLRNVEDTGEPLDEAIAPVGSVAGAVMMPKIKDLSNSASAAIKEHLEYLNKAPLALPEEGSKVESLAISQSVQRGGDVLADVKKIRFSDLPDLDNGYLISKDGKTILGEYYTGKVYKINERFTDLLKKKGYEVADFALGEGEILDLKVVGTKAYQVAKVSQFVKSAGGVVKYIGGQSYVVSELGEVIGKVTTAGYVEKIEQISVEELKTLGYKVADSAKGGSGNIIPGLKLADDAKFVQTSAGKIIGPLEEAGILVKYRGALRFVSNKAALFGTIAQAAGHGFMFYGLVCDTYTISRALDLSIDLYSANADERLSSDLVDGRYWTLAYKTGAKIVVLEDAAAKLENTYGSGEGLPAEIGQSIFNIRKIIADAKAENLKFKKRYITFYDNLDTEYSKITTQEGLALFNQYHETQKQLNQLSDEVKGLTQYLDDLQSGKADSIGYVPIVGASGFTPTYLSDYTLTSADLSRESRQRILRKGLETKFYFEFLPKPIEGQQNIEVSGFENYKNANVGIFVYFEKKLNWLQLIVPPGNYRIGYVDYIGTIHIDKAAFNDAVLGWDDKETNLALNDYIFLQGAVVDGSEVYPSEYAL